MPLQNNDPIYDSTLSEILSLVTKDGTRASATDIPNVDVEFMRTAAYPSGAWHGHAGDHASQATVTAMQTSLLAAGATVKVAGVMQVWSGVSWDSADGFDVLLLIGQSNMNGAGVYDAVYDADPNGVYQFTSTPTSRYYQQVLPAADPLYMPDAVKTTATSIGSWFARRYADAIRPRGRKLLIVPVAVGGTALVNGPWDPDGAGANGHLYRMAITQANLAVKWAKLRSPSSQFVGAVWAQGEADGDASVSQATYYGKLSTLIAGLRAGISGASGSWFMISGMVPEAISSHATYLPIQAAHKQAAASIPRVGYIDGVAGYCTDSMHYLSEGIRIQGPALCSAALALGATPTVSAPAKSLRLWNAESVPAATVAPGWTGTSTWRTADSTTPMGNAGICVGFTNASTIVFGSEPVVKAGQSFGDCRISFRYRGSADRPVIMVRAQASAGYGALPGGYCVMLQPSTGNIQMYKLSGGAPTAIGSGATFAAMQTQAIFVRLTIQGQTLTVDYSDDGKIWNTRTVDDTTFASGDIAIGSWAGVTPLGGYFDDIVIEEL